MGSAEDGDFPTPRTVELRLPSRTHALVPELSLRVSAGPDAGLTLSSSGERTAIGTHPSNTPVLKDPTLSRFHCELVFRDGRVLVRDLGSRNGTTLETISVLEAYVTSGAVLGVGQSQVRVDLGGGQVKIPLSAEERFGPLVGRSRARPAPARRWRPRRSTRRARASRDRS